MRTALETANFRVVNAVLPAELALKPSGRLSAGPCPGDGCNDDQGGHDDCPSDASCGQDCCT